MFNLQVFIIALTVLVVVGIGAYLLEQKRLRDNKKSDKPTEKGCSIVFYIFIGLLFLFFVVGYILYKKQAG